MTELFPNEGLDYLLGIVPKGGTCKLLTLSRRQLGEVGEPVHCTGVNRRLL